LSAHSVRTSERIERWFGAGCSAIRRCGELLQQVEANRTTAEKTQEAAHRSFSRTHAASDAALSGHQRKTARAWRTCPSPIPRSGRKHDRNSRLARDVVSLFARQVSSSVVVVQENARPPVL
jgi:hypothetical protein